ncbi:hypothetical protein RCL1_004486 [Eukaryota sp. TZLM3-RCL]
MTITPEVTFTINGALHSVAPRYHLLSLAEYLRSDEVGLKGTKESSMEGVNGASTIMLSTYDEVLDRVVSKAVAASVLPLYSLHNCAVTTIEGIGSSHRKTVHEIQEAFSSNYGSQCGYCTPGIITSLYTLLREEKGDKSVSAQDLEDTLLSASCRCTGYHAIYDSVSPFITKGKNPCDRVAKLVKNVEQPFPQEFMVPITDLIHPTWAIASSIDSALSLMNQGYTPVAGCNEIRRNYMKKNDFSTKMVSINRIKALRTTTITEAKNGIQSIMIGSAVTISEFYDTLMELERSTQYTGIKRISSNLAVHLKNLGNLQLRNSGTIAGNLLNRSRYSDLIPVFSVLNASFNFVNPKDNSESSVSFEQVSDYTGHLLTSITIDLPISDSVFFSVAKAGKRRVNAKTSITQAILFSSLDSIYRIAVSNLSASVSTNFPAFLDQISGNFVVQDVFSALSSDISNLADVGDYQGSSEYRSQLALNLSKLMVEKYQSFLNGDVSSANQSNVISDRPLGLQFSHSSHRTYETINKTSETHVSNQPVLPQDSTILATGEAVFTSDLKAPVSTLHAQFVISSFAHGKILSISTEKARKALGVKFVDFVSAKDITGTDGFTGIVFDTMTFATDTVHYAGQPIGLAVCTTPEAAKLASNLIEIEYESLPAFITVEEAFENKSFHPSYRF